MSKLIVTADVHGSYSTWVTLKDLAGTNHSLAVAGDLFGTRYPRFHSSDYQPDEIKKQLSDFNNPFYLVYGNCDKKSFYPNQEYIFIFQFMDKKILIHHGDKYLKKIPASIDIIIQGHTHIGVLEKQNNIIFLNPGSLTAPRNNFYTYAVVDNENVSLINIKDNKTIKSIRLF